MTLASKIKRIIKGLILIPLMLISIIVSLAIVFLVAIIYIIKEIIDACEAHLC